MLEKGGEGRERKRKEDTCQVNGKVDERHEMEVSKSGGCGEG